jgi:hypothetical protein
MHGISCCRLPIFKIENFDYGSQIKSLDFHLAPLQNLMSTLPYPHRHDFYQIDWVEHGTGHHIIDSVKYEVKPKTLFFMAPGPDPRLRAVGRHGRLHDQLQRRVLRAAAAEQEHAQRAADLRSRQQRAGAVPRRSAGAAASSRRSTPSARNT